MRAQLFPQTKGCYRQGENEKLSCEVVSEMVDSSGNKKVNSKTGTIVRREMGSKAGGRGGPLRTTPTKRPRKSLSGLKKDSKAMGAPRNSKEG